MLLDPADQVHPLAELFDEDLLVALPRPAEGTHPRGGGSASGLAEEVECVLQMVSEEQVSDRTS